MFAGSCMERKREEKTKRGGLENKAEMRVEGEGEEEWRRERGWVLRCAVREEC